LSKDFGATGDSFDVLFACEDTFFFFCFYLWNEKKGNSVSYIGNLAELPPFH
jgi:hypothetical protein